MGEEEQKKEEHAEEENSIHETIEEPKSEEDIYKKEDRKEMVDDAEISPEEEGFMKGYDKADEEKPEEKVEEQPKKELIEEKKEKQTKKEKHKEKVKKEKKTLKQTIKHLYEKKYKKLLIIPFTLLILSLILIGIQIATTGDFIRKDVSLSGGITITIQSDKDVNVLDIKDYLNNQFPDSELSVRGLKQTGRQIGLIIEGTEDIESEQIITSLTSKIGELEKDQYSVAVMGSSLGASFFRETIKAIYISFLFMGIVIFLYFSKGTKIKIISTFLTLIAAMLMFGGSHSTLKSVIAYLIGITLLVIYFKKSIPSFVVILNVFSDVIVTLAIIDLIGMKLSTAGIAAFLMIIGYSVDTNILLSTKLLKRKEGTVFERLIGSMKTGLTMTLTTSVAIIVALMFTQSSVIQQIMTILFIGLIVDMIYTWLQNAGILRLYLDKKNNETQS
ncbi:hypothetical protein CEE44_03710 [Candidatus Woesearchaeota archaeon B3_Woes]|nr:MAG: hypothetical protein CEE44_03710 [Candidatus Woesearchaeota archaeon B3_Woes]